MTRVLEKPLSFSNSFISLPFSLVLSFCRSNRYTCTNAASSFVHFFFHVTTAGKRAGRINISHRRFDLVLVAVAASSSYPSKVVLIVSESKSGGTKRISESLINLPFYHTSTDARETHVSITYMCESTCTANMSTHSCASQSQCIQCMNQHFTRIKLCETLAKYSMF